MSAAVSPMPAPSATITTFPPASTVDLHATLAATVEALDQLRAENARLLARDRWTRDLFSNPFIKAGRAKRLYVLANKTGYIPGDHIGTPVPIAADAFKDAGVDARASVWAGDVADGMVIRIPGDKVQQADGTYREPPVRYSFGPDIAEVANWLPSDYRPAGGDQTPRCANPACPSTNVTRKRATFDECADCGTIATIGDEYTVTRAPGSRFGNPVVDADRVAENAELNALTPESLPGSSFGHPVAAPEEPDPLAAGQPFRLASEGHPDGSAGSACVKAAPAAPGGVPPASDTALAGHAAPPTDQLGVAQLGAVQGSAVGAASDSAATLDGLAERSDTMAVPPSERSAEGDAPAGEAAGPLSKPTWFAAPPTPTPAAAVRVVPQRHNISRRGFLAAPDDRV